MAEDRFRKSREAALKPEAASSHGNSPLKLNVDRPSTANRAKQSAHTTGYSSTAKSACSQVRTSHETWVADLASQLNQGYDGAYVGFLGDDGAERVPAAYPGQTWERLKAIKAPLRPGKRLPPEPEHPATGHAVTLIVNTARDPDREIGSFHLRVKGGQREEPAAPRVCGRPGWAWILDSTAWAVS